MSWRGVCKVGEDPMLCQGPWPAASCQLTGPVPHPQEPPPLSIWELFLLVGECGLWPSLETEAPGPTTALPQLPLPGDWGEGISCLEVLAAPTAMETSVEAGRASVPSHCSAQPAGGRGGQGPGQLQEPSPKDGQVGASAWAYLPITHGSTPTHCTSQQGPNPE